ncbi:Rho GTPase effector BNI1 and related formins [Plasmopara halstedii]|uniref:Rho GTPase effector BNI1 and related formins n=1 Tax=Plasmopara halstedii TaxID=4781 RepID=A0A0P1API9_PLAHL|nr:Rho GTPase effector BNI1 and related formins [Plasmopara halstedii]CEG42685.1 Rho GTPase effector BNI1 and related formins [Plasmopara halstedii]|eukprot:XP_024579054.1 Rho GTPase effector BNI1 and related formins [Plasmopara halstedii]
MAIAAEKGNEKEVNLKENEVLPPTLALVTEREDSAVKLTGLQTEYASYLHMLKVGLPRIVVDHKLRAENKDPKVLDKLLAIQKGQKPKRLELSLLEKPEDVKDIEHMQKIESFLRMIKVGVPRHLVEMKALRDGVKPAELKTEATKLDEFVPANIATLSRRSSISSIISTAPSTPDASAKPSCFSTTDQNVVKKGFCKTKIGTRKRVHWSTTIYTDSVFPSGHNSLWDQIHTKDLHNRVCISSESRQWMNKLFVKAGTTASGSQRHTQSGIIDQTTTDSHSKTTKRDCVIVDDWSDLEPEPEVEMDELSATKPKFQRKQFVMLLDLKKSQNIAIVLARVKRTFFELTQDILTLNCNALSSTALQSLIDMWPDCTEQDAIHQFRGDVATLATAERFLIVALKIPRAQQKLRCLQYKLDFESRVKELRENLSLLSRGIEQVCASDRFAGVFEYIFHLGNLLNFGEDVEYTKFIKSISISSLAKLSFTKAYDGQITFLQYVIQSVERDEPHLAFFSDQLSLITKCSKLSYQTLLAEYQVLQTGLHLLINETQTAAVYETNDANLRALLMESRESMKFYVMDVKRELENVQEFVNTLENKRKRFYDYFEEVTSLPIDELLGCIANFAVEFSRERQQLILQGRQAQKATHNRMTSVHYRPQKRHSL